MTIAQAEEIVDHPLEETAAWLSDVADDPLAFAECAFWGKGSQLELETTRARRRGDRVRRRGPAFERGLKFWESFRINDNRSVSVRCGACMAALAKTRTPPEQEKGGVSGTLLGHFFLRAPLAKRLDAPEVSYAARSRQFRPNRSFSAAALRSGIAEIRRVTESRCGVAVPVRRGVAGAVRCGVNCAPICPSVNPSVDACNALRS